SHRSAQGDITICPRSAANGNGRLGGGMMFARKHMNIDTLELLQLTSNRLIGQSVAILGIKGSGKSNTAAVLMEELLDAGIPVTIVDIAGEYHSLKANYPHITVIGRSIYGDVVEIPLTRENTEQVAATAYTNGSSVVIDVSGVYEEDSRDQLLAIYFGTVWRQALQRRIPAVIFLEEAHNYIPQRGRTGVRDLFTRIAAEGRQWGLSLVIVSQRSARIDKDVLTQADIAFMHKVRHPTDMKLYTDIIPRQARWVRERVNGLKAGEALVLVGDQVLRCQMRLRHTQHVGATPTMKNLPQQLPLFDLWQEGRES
ncbi:MAG: DUF87 domain-containing protein, partial [Anaerolineae bacterium]|nr:DUF87 domain-containing protein [Anaerolineae bacterium]